MRCLLLLLTLFWVVHSAKQKFKQIELSYANCTNLYFCIVSPNSALQTNSDTDVVKMVQGNINTPPEFGLLIKPLTPNKWLVIMRNEKESDEVNGFKLFVKNKDDLNNPWQNNLIAGCNKDGAITGITPPGQEPKFKFEVRLGESVFKHRKEMICVGILSGEGIAGLLDGAQTTTHRIFFMVSKYAQASGRWRANDIEWMVSEQMLDKGPLDFKKAVTETLRCDYDLLKPPDSKERLRTHYLREVATYGDTIDCWDAKEKYNPTANFDLIVKFNEKEAFPVDKITCEPSIGDQYALFYYRHDQKPEIKEDAIVACGERPSCSLPPVTVCTNCNQSEIVEETCNAAKDKCEELKCPNNRWFINKDERSMGNEMIGKVVCHKESKEDESPPRWFAVPNDLPPGGKKIPFENGYCSNLYECNATTLQRTCEGKDVKKCFRPSFVPNGIYCPVNYDIKYTKIAGGQEYEIKRKTLEPEIQILCDQQSGKWKLKDGTETEIDTVFCTWNQDRDHQMRGGAAKVSEDDWESDENFWWVFKYWYIIFPPFILYLPFYMLFYNYFEKKRDDKVKKRKIWVENVMKKRKDRTKKDWTRWEKWMVRPFNYLKIPIKIYHNVCGDKPLRIGPGRYGKTQLGFNDLRGRNHKALNAGFIKDFSLYSMDEKYSLLTNVVHGFSTKERAILLTIPLLKKCLEYDEVAWDTSLKANLKQPMHPMLVAAAFRILRLLVNVYSKREKEEEAERVRKIMGIRANNILFDLGLERALGEPELTTTMRNICLEAALFARHKDVENRLLKVWEVKQFDCSNPMRKFVWAVAVKNDKAFNLIVKKFNAEVIKYHQRWDQPTDPDDENWGDILEHLIYAMGAEPDRRLEYMVHYVVRNEIFTERHVLAVFHSMLELFDYNHLSARLMFKEYHDLMLKKMRCDSEVYVKIFTMMYQWCGYWKGHPKWLTAFVAKKFSHEERVCLLTPMLFSYLECYKATHKFTKCVAIIEKELSWVDHVKKDERIDPPPIPLNRRRMPLKPKREKKKVSHRSWRDVGYRKVAKKEDSAKNSKESVKPGLQTGERMPTEMTGIAETGQIQRSLKSGVEKGALKTGREKKSVKSGKEKESMKTGREKVKSLVEKTASAGEEKSTQKEKSGSVKGKANKSKH